MKYVPWTLGEQHQISRIKIEEAAAKHDLAPVSQSFMPELRTVRDPTTDNQIRYGEVQVDDCVVRAQALEITREMRDDNLPPETAAADELIRTRLWYAILAARNPKDFPLELGFIEAQIRRRGEFYPMPVYAQDGPVMGDNLHDVGDLLLTTHRWVRTEPMTEEELGYTLPTLRFSRALELGSETARQPAIDELLRQCAVAIWAWHVGAQSVSMQAVWRTEPKIEDHVDHLGRRFVHVYTRLCMVPAGGKRISDMFQHDLSARSIY